MQMDTNQVDVSKNCAEYKDHTQSHVSQLCADNYINWVIPIMGGRDTQNVYLLRISLPERTIVSVSEFN